MTHPSLYTGNAPAGTARQTRHGGMDLTFSGDGLARFLPDDLDPIVAAYLQQRTTDPTLPSVGAFLSACDLMRQRFRTRGEHNGNPTFSGNIDALGWQPTHLRSALFLANQAAAAEDATDEIETIRDAIEEAVERPTRFPGYSDTAGPGSINTVSTAGHNVSFEIGRHAWNLLMHPVMRDEVNRYRHLRAQKTPTELDPFYESLSRTLRDARAHNRHNGPDAVRGVIQRQHLGPMLQIVDAVLALCDQDAATGIRCKSPHAHPDNDGDLVPVATIRTDLQPLRTRLAAAMGEPATIEQVAA